MVSRTETNTYTEANDRLQEKRERKAIKQHDERQTVKGQCDMMTICLTLLYFGANETFK